MRFLAAIFGFCALMSIGWICVGAVATGQAASQVTNQPMRSSEQAATALGVALGGSLSLSLFVCTGGPAALIFGILALICNNSANTARYREEMMRLERERTAHMGYMAAAQMSQAQSQSQIAGKRKNDSYRSPYDL